MSSEVTICNMALGHLGHDRPISALSESSTEAEACNRFYSEARDAVLALHPWDFARTFRTLSPDATLTTVPDGWTYAYIYPSDCIRARYIVHPAGRNTAAPIPFERAIKNDGATELILTDQDAAELCYTLRVTDVTRFPPLFLQALSYYLAWQISPSIGQRDKQRTMLEQFSALLDIGGAVNMNETPQPPRRTPGYIAARG